MSNKLFEDDFLAVAFNNSVKITHYSSLQYRSISHFSHIDEPITAKNMSLNIERILND